jgi:hypothetical protein
MAAMAAMAVAAVAIDATAAGTDSALPTSLAGVSIGEQWQSVEARNQVTSLDHLAVPWDHHARACGYRSALLARDKGELLIEVQDFVVTQLSYSTPIEAGSDVRALADEVIRSFGNPVFAEMRDALGRPTIGADVNTIVLGYDSPNPVRFTLSGAATWRYNVTVDHEDTRLHQNTMLRCARERERRGGG